MHSFVFGPRRSIRNDFELSSQFREADPKTRFYPVYISFSKITEQTTMIFESLLPRRSMCLLKKGFDKFIWIHNYSETKYMFFIN